MVQLALLVLAPLLGFTVADRRTIVGVLVGAWAALMIPQTHVVLLDEQLATRSMANTASYLIVNYLTLAIGVALALWLNRRRQATRRIEGVDSAAA